MMTAWMVRPSIRYMKNFTSLLHSWMRFSTFFRPMEVGEVSSIVPDYLTDCWAYYRKKFPLIEKAEMKIEILPAVTYCEACGKTYPTVEYGRQCPHCGSWDTYLAAGDECNIREIEAC